MLPCYVDGATGAFDFDTLFPGRYSVVQLDRAGSTVFESNWVEVGEGERVDFGTLVVGEQPSLSIRARVEPGSKGLLERVRVRLTRVDGSGGYYPEFDGEGWTIDQILPGAYELQFSEPGDETLRTVVVTAGSDQLVEFDLEFCSPTVIWFEPPEGVPLSTIWVEVTGPLGAVVWKKPVFPSESRPARPLGAYLALPKGSYWVSAKTETGLSGAGEIVIEHDDGRAQHVIEIR